MQSLYLQFYCVIGCTTELIIRPDKEATFIVKGDQQIPLLPKLNIKPVKRFIIQVSYLTSCSNKYSKVSKG